MKPQSKTINFRNRIQRFLKRRSATKSSLQTTKAAPGINNLYKLNFFFAGRLQEGIIARYDGKSKSGLFHKFVLTRFVDSKGVQVNLVCLSELPANLQQLKPNLFTHLTRIA